MYPFPPVTIEPSGLVGVSSLDFLFSSLPRLVLFLGLVFTVVLSKVVLPLYSGLPKRASIFSVLWFYTTDGLILGLHRLRYRLAFLHVTMSPDLVTRMPRSSSHAGTTPVTDVLIQLIDRDRRCNTGYFPNFRRRWKLNYRPAAWRGDNLSTSLSHHTLNVQFLLKDFIYFFC